MNTLELWPIGNCQVSALVDSNGRFAWGCAPRVDGEPVFSALLDEDEPQHGFWVIEIEDIAVTSQFYLRNTPILVTQQIDKSGNAIEVIDFCPYYRRMGRNYRPVAFARIVRPLNGAPQVRMRLRPNKGWGSVARASIGGTSHIRFGAPGMTMRLTTTAPVSLIHAERFFRLEDRLHFFLGPDESFEGDIGSTVDDMLERTIYEWRSWVRGLAIPLEWQEAVVRAAIGLKLCQHEETGAIVAALTSSIPEHADSGRNWDYRYCWIRDAYYTVQALNRLGALDVLEGFLVYLRNIVDQAKDGAIQPLYSVLGEAALDERIVSELPGYRGMGPVRVGNEAFRQVQHDAYGQIVLSSTQAFLDIRLFRTASESDFAALERVGEQAWLHHDKPDAGLWEFRTRQEVHTYSSAMCWAACDRLANAANTLGLVEKSAFWHERANLIRTRIETRAWREDSGRFSATLEGDALDASVMQLLELRFLSPDDARFLDTLAAIEEGLRRGSHMLRYAHEDDFGTPQSAFNICTFWLIEALHFTGRTDEARDLFEEMLARRTGAGLLSEDIDPDSGELWGNYPQTYSLAGIINCAVLLSKPWSSVR
ncbi:MAG: glycoside hydrolase family 15 protein [Novosphingobium sp.]|nr:glycoside hydrolase family 15 protein [Novosphingobium sp.]